MKVDFQYNADEILHNIFLLDNFSVFYEGFKLNKSIDQTKIKSIKDILDNPKNQKEKEEMKRLKLFINPIEDHEKKKKKPVKRNF